MLGKQQLLPPQQLFLQHQQMTVVEDTPPWLPGLSRNLNLAFPLFLKSQLEWNQQNFQK